MATVTPLPFDPTGTKPTNRIVGEQQVIVSVNFRDYHYIIPAQAPFFAQNLVLGFKNPDGSSRTLIEGVDFYLSHEFISASRATAKPVFGSIEFLFTDLAGVVTLNYQSIGGDWTLDQNAIAAIIANSLTNPRTTSWEQVANPPYAFPVIDHVWDLVDLVGASAIVNSLEDIRETISEGGASGLATHVADKGNPHDVTAVQVGLGSVQNFPLASVSQAQQGTNATTYMTPYLTQQAIQALGQGGLQSHLQDFNNPHQTTKNQVGLGNVQNYGVATNPQALAGTDTASYMTPALTAAVVAVVNAALTNHVNNQLNPHNVTKDQIQLANVQNYPVATAQQAQDGADNASYMTPLRTAQAIALQSSSGLQIHLQDYNNPHQTTKNQVGLGLVDNFPTATGSQAVDQSNAATFMTPQRTYASVMQFVGNDFLTHVNNSNNPHTVTKAQVGLGLVNNFPLATTAQAQAGSDNASYMTPALVAAAINNQLSGGGIQAHIADHNNPHVTTAAQVGLGNVSNFATATTADATSGTSTTLFMTPALVASAIGTQVGTALTSHINNINNPHQTTATQLGLGAVQNYGIATQSDATAGTSNILYMTPQGVAQAITSQVGSAFAAHVAAENPHGTTKADVGLGNVSNYAMATDSEAAAGTSTTTFLSPHGASLLTGGASALASHVNDHNNPHVTTASQVGLGLVQNYGVATAQQAQAGTDTQTYMTPSLTASAISLQGAALVAGHANRTDNPHAVTASQVGAYSTQQVDQMLTAKLDSSGVAADSTLFNGKTEAQIENIIAAQVNAGVGSVSASTATQKMLLSNSVDPNNTTSYGWASLGTLKAISQADQLPAEAQSAAPDIVWLISGGEDPSAINGVTTLLRVSIRDTVDPSNPINYFLQDQTPSLATGGVDFGYTYDVPSATATIYARMPKQSNQLTVTELNQGASKINLTYLGYQNVPTVTMMTKVQSLPSMQAQITQLQSDVVAGLAALATALNNM